MSFKKEDRYKWLVLFISFTLVMVFGISLQVLPPLFDKISNDIPLSDSQAGILMGAYVFPGIFLPFLTAILANRYGEKPVILIALTTMALGLAAFAMAKSFVTLLTFRLIAGAGATGLVVLSPLLITKVFDQKNIGVGMGLFNAAMPTGTVLAANIFTFLNAGTDWRHITFAIAGITAIVLLMCYFLLHIPKKDISEASGKLNKKSSMDFCWSNKGFWSIAIIWTLVNAQVASYITFAPQYYRINGMSIQAAGFLTSLIMFMQIFLCPLTGIIIDKTGWKTRLLLIGNIVIAISFIFIGKGLFSLPLWAVLLGIGVTPIPVLVYALLPEMVEPRHVGMGLGMLTAVSNIGTTSGTSFFGTFLDITGRNFTLGFIVLALITLGNLFTITGLRNKT